MIYFQRDFEKAVLVVAPQADVIETLDRSSIFSTWLSCVSKNNLQHLP